LQQLIQHFQLKQFVLRKAMLADLGDSLEQQTLVVMNWPLAM